MSGNRRKPNKSANGKQPGKGRQQRPAATPSLDIWRPVPELPAPTAVTPADDPTALIRSLGTPPLPGQAAVAGHYLAAVVERASGVATALAAAAGLFDQTDDPDGWT